MLYFLYFFFHYYKESLYFFFFFQAEDGIRDGTVTGVQTCALPIFVLLRARTWSFNSKAIPGIRRALFRFNASPHSSQKNSSRISRKCAGERKLLSRRKSAPSEGKCASRIAVQRS